jgi:serine/threonine protein kinase
VQIAHLDIKPANVVLRDGSGVAVLVDFGLAGRRLRPGCGSAHYGAGEIWAEHSDDDPFGADVYAAACVAFEILTNQPLVTGDTLKEVIDQHMSSRPGGAVLDALARSPQLAPLAQVIGAAVVRDPRRRPTVARLRAGFAAIAPDLRSLAWPFAVG